MNGGLDLVSYIIKIKGLGLVVIIMHFKCAGMNSLLQINTSTSHIGHL